MSESVRVSKVNLAFKLETRKEAAHGSESARVSDGEVCKGPSELERHGVMHMKTAGETAASNRNLTAMGMRF